MTTLALEFMFSFLVEGRELPAKILLRVFEGNDGPLVLATQLGASENPGPSVDEAARSLIATLRMPVLEVPSLAGEARNSFALVTHYNGKSFDEIGAAGIATEPSFTLVNWHMDGDEIVIDPPRPMTEEEMSERIGLPVETIRRL